MAKKDEDFAYVKEDLGGNVIGQIVLGVTDKCEIRVVEITGRAGLVRKNAIRNALAMIDRALIKSRSKIKDHNKTRQADIVAKKRKEEAEKQKQDKPKAKPGASAPVKPSNQGGK